MPAVASVIPAVTLTGSVGSLPAKSAFVIVEAEVALGGDPARLQSPDRLVDVPVATAAISGPSFRVPVPDSPLLRMAEQINHGDVEFAVVADSGGRSTSLYRSVPLTATAAAGNDSAVMAVRTRVVRFGRFPAFKPAGRTMRAVESAVAAAVPTIIPCTWSAYGSSTNTETTIGQVHVAVVSGTAPTDDYKYTVSADTTISFGTSASPSSGYSFSGSVTINNSISASGHKTYGMSTGNGEDVYIDTLMYYQRYRDNAADTCPDPGIILYKNPAYQSAGNVATGSKSSGYNPYGGCRKDPNGSVPLTANNGYSSDRAHAFTQTVDGTLWGFSFSGSAGFTNEVLQDYEGPPGAVTTYICGNGQLPNVSLIYDTT